MSRQLPIFGVAGGIGSGKSAASEVLVREGGRLIDADRLGHDALRDSAVKVQARDRWGDAIFRPDGEIDRRKLGGIVFRDDVERQHLESLVFPFIEAGIEREIEAANRPPSPKFIVLDAAIMFETGWAKRCDRVLFVDVPRDLRLARLRASRGWDDAELARREASQWSVEKKRSLADKVVDNSGGIDELAGKVRAIVAAWLGELARRT